ncbi:hypothetical protein EDD21DRAFT_352116 [Dissophora ornata]|nr:hypothetical protein EDD21DRAFT_352116 [Dissophora ornata]
MALCPSAARSGTRPESMVYPDRAPRKYPEIRLVYYMLMNNFSRKAPISMLILYAVHSTFAIKEHLEVSRRTEKCIWTQLTYLMHKTADASKGSQALVQGAVAGSRRFRDESWFRALSRVPALHCPCQDRRSPCQHLYEECAHFVLYRILGTTAKENAVCR